MRANSLLLQGASSRIHGNRSEAFRLRLSEHFSQVFANVVRSITSDSLRRVQVHLSDRDRVINYGAGTIARRLRRRINRRGHLAYVLRSLLVPVEGRGRILRR